MTPSRDTVLNEGRVDRTAGQPTAGDLLRIWLSPSFPVGAFAYSHGLETAVARGLVSNAADLGDWLAALADHGSLGNDLILLAAAWRAAVAGDDRQVAELNSIAVAVQPSAERHLETTQQGGSFAATIAAAWPCEAIDRLREPDRPIAYPVAVGVAAAGHAVPLAEVLSGFAVGFVMNLVSAAIRLSVIGQTDGQRVIAHLMPALARVAERAQAQSMDDLGGAAYSSDLASLEHETLYSRLFRS